MKTLNVYSNGKWEEVVGSPAGLEDYAKTEYVDAAIAAIPATDLSGYYTKLETDAAIKVCRDEGALDLDAVQNQVLYAVTETARQLQVKIDLKADKADTYTKVEVDGKFAPLSTTTLITTQLQAIFDSIYTRAECDGRYAKLDDATQTIVAGTVRATRHEFSGNAALAWEDVGGTARPVYKAGSKTFPLAFTTEVGGGSVDLSAYAKLQDNQQPFLAKTVVSQAYGFGDTLLPPVALGYSDTGEGYGNRLVLNVGLLNEYLVYKSDLDSLNALLPRIETLESKAAPVVDLAPYVTLETADAVYGRKDALDLLRGQVQTIFDSIYTRAEADARYAPKATTYTKVECDSKFLTLVDVDQYAFKAEVYTQKQTDDRFMRITDAFSKTDFDNQMALFLYSRKQVDDRIAETYKKAETYTKAEVETRLLEVPSPMKYLQWGGAFQKMLAGNAKDKWFGAGLLPSIQIVKGKHYRLEMTTKFGPLNADYKECWVGFRFNYKALNELPCTKQPLVTMGGFGHTTVTRARAAIAATAVATTTPTRADRFRFLAVDDWASAEDIIDYAVEFEADQDIPSANFVPEICFGGTWGQYPTNFEGVVAVFRQMD